MPSLDYDLAATISQCLPKQAQNAPLSLLPLARLSLADYLASLMSARPETKPLQDGNDYLDLLCQECEELGFAGHAKCLRQELEEHFHAQTANHLGIDSHPEFFQANLLYALGCRHCVPIFSGGIGYLTNDAYPRGVILSRVDKNPADFIRLALLPKNPNCLVSLRPAYEFKDLPLKEGVGSFSFKPEFAKKLAEKKCTSAEAFAIKRLLSEFFGDAKVCAQKSLRNQLCCINMKRWQRLRAGTDLPPLVCLDTSWLVWKLACLDLKNSDSLLSYLLTSGILPDLYQALHGVLGCWEDDAKGTPLHGTFLFWGIDADRRLVALRPNATYSELFAKNRSFPTIPLQSSALAKGLQTGQLLPSLFCEFVMTAMARGLNCTGGIFQFNYLPLMAKGL
ncbi:MAG: hypothetical protein IJS50_00365, partial [Desulfovibrio sp.]|nr:hypothetical protein [Desulfovibrio sp.]